MPVRIKITFLFTMVVVLILAVVCSSAYFFFKSSRTVSIKSRLTSRAITIGRMLTQREFFSNELIEKIDASKSYVMKNNVLFAFDHNNQLIYKYISESGDTLLFSKERLNEARTTESVYFTEKRKDVVAYNYKTPTEDLVIIAAGEDEEGWQLIDGLVKILSISFVTGVTLAAIGGYYFSRQLLRPVNKIADDVKDISAFNLSRRIEEGKAKDEWYHLASNLNDLLNRLQESFDIQKRFISNASHELSTPLTSISSQLEVSLQRDRSAHEYKETMESVYHDVVHLTNLTHTLLQFAKASGTPAGLEISLVRIDEVLMRLPYELSNTNKGYSVTLSFDELPAEEEKLFVFGNENLLLVAVKNIAVNACKYSSDHNAIVQLAVKGNTININIIDKGVGIPKEELNKIFQPFYRVADFSEKEGFGLGLSLASKIISLHKGKISVDSIVGTGTTFHISLPGAKEFITTGNSKQNL